MSTIAQVPPVGTYWAKYRDLGGANPDFDNMRRGLTAPFDNLRAGVSDAWRRLSPLIPVDYEYLIRDSGRGNPPVSTIQTSRAGALRASVGSIEYAAMLSVILPHLMHIPDVLEIGGGYGGLAWAGRTAGIDKWTIVDLPWVARFSRRYLKGTDVRIICPEEFAVEDHSYSLVIQTRGFMEMSDPEIAFYFDAIQGRALSPGGLFFTINRFHKVSDFVSYPFDSKWKILKSGIWPEGAGMAMLLLERTADSRSDVPSLLDEWGNR